MDYPCGRFDDCSFSRFSSVVRTDAYTYTQTRMNALLPRLSSAWVVKQCLTVKIISEAYIARFLFKRTHASKIKSAQETQQTQENYASKKQKYASTSHATDASGPCARKRNDRIDSIFHATLRAFEWKPGIRGVIVLNDRKYGQLVSFRCSIIICQCHKYM